MLEKLNNELGDELDSCADLKGLQDIRVKYLGKSSAINSEMKKLGGMSPEERKEAGQKINQIKNKLQASIEEFAAELENRLLEEQLEKEWVDLSLPGRPVKEGSIHPITQALEELTQIFAKYGFESKDGPGIEDDWHNFTALNIPENHPARQMHDTFYLKAQEGEEPRVLRTHTSPIQIRTMESGKPPFRFIAPGRTFRSDYDMTHTPMFHQIEGMVIDKDINIGHMKYVIIDFVRTFFERDDIEVQFRPSFFPFTEPSAEVDIRLNKNDKWLEILGCGMVHPKVLQNVGINPEEFQGFAFGMGIERMAMLKYGIKDLRKFFEGDIRWIKHYNFEYFDVPSLAGGLTR